MRRRWCKPGTDAAASYRGRQLSRRKLRQQRSDYAGLALVKPFRMKSLLEREQLVVEMVANLVDHRAQESLERDDVLFLRGAHPYADACRRSFIFRFVEAV